MPQIIGSMSSSALNRRDRLARRRSAGAAFQLGKVYDHFQSGRRARPPHSRAARSGGELIERGGECGSIRSVAGLGTLVPKQGTWTAGHLQLPRLCRETGVFWRRRGSGDFGDRCPNRLGGGADGRGRPCSSGQRNLVREPNHPLHVVQEVGETDLGAGPGDANGADE